MAMAKMRKTNTDWMVVEEGSPSLMELSASVPEALSLIFEWIRQQQDSHDKVLPPDVEL